VLAYSLRRRRAESLGARIIRPPAAGRIADIKPRKSKRFPDHHPAPGGRCCCQEILHSPSVMPLPVGRLVCKSLFLKQVSMNGVILAKHFAGLGETPSHA